MTRSERTQLGWLTYWALSGGTGSSRITAGFRRLLFWFAVFSLACLAAGAVLEITHWVVG